jgi:hypothetical protein
MDSHRGLEAHQPSRFGDPPHCINIFARAEIRIKWLIAESGTSRHHCCRRHVTKMRTWPDDLWSRSHVESGISSLEPVDDRRSTLRHYPGCNDRESLLVH